MIDVFSLLSLQGRRPLWSSSLLVQRLQPAVPLRAGLLLCPLSAEPRLVLARRAGPAVVLGASLALAAPTALLCTTGPPVDGRVEILRLLWLPLLPL